MSASFRPLAGSIDEPAAGSTAAPGRLRVRGWALDQTALLDRVHIVVGDLPPVAVVPSVWRSDVAAVFPHVPHAGGSGFTADLELPPGPGGPVPVALLVRTADRHWHELASAVIETESRPAEPPGSRPCAAFTIVQNEATMLPLWLRHYGAQFAAEDLYVLDHGSEDGSTTGLESRCRVIPVHRTVSFEHRWLRGTVEAFQRFLLRSYATVVFAEVDEFLIADPHRYADLADYIARMPGPAARASGFNVVHQDGEPELDFSAPILAQRSTWHASETYSKRLIARMPLHWSEGFHQEYAAPAAEPDPHLLLAHLHRVDRAWCRARHRATAARRWSAEDLARGDGWQNRLAADDEFDAWFRSPEDLGSPPELIPEHIKGCL